MIFSWISHEGSFCQGELYVAFGRTRIYLFLSTTLFRFLITRLIGRRCSGLKNRIIIGDYSSFKISASDAFSSFESALIQLLDRHPLLGTFLSLCWCWQYIVIYFPFSVICEESWYFRVIMSFWRQRASVLKKPRLIDGWYDSQFRSHDVLLWSISHHDRTLDVLLLD